MMQRARPPVSSNARRYRRQHQLSLGEVARRASLSKATLSTLESGTGNPTVSTLVALAATFGVDPAMLLASAGSGQDRRLVRQGDAERPGTDDVPIDRFDVVGEVAIYDVRYEDGDRFQFDGHGAGTIERVMAVEGRLEVGSVDDPVVLEPGDYVSFDASRPHAFGAPDGPARATLFVSTAGVMRGTTSVHAATRRGLRPG